MNTCKDCKDRHVGCHGKCEKYKQWRAEYEKAKKIYNSNYMKRNVGYYHK